MADEGGGKGKGQNGVACDRRAICPTFSSVSAHPNSVPLGRRVAFAAKPPEAIEPPLEAAAHWARCQLIERIKPFYTDSASHADWPLSPDRKNFVVRQISEVFRSEVENSIARIQTQLRCRACWEQRRNEQSAIIRERDEARIECCIVSGAEQQTIVLVQALHGVGICHPGDRLTMQIHATAYQRPALLLLV